MLSLLLMVLGVGLVQEDVKPTETELRRAREMLAGAWTIVSATDDGDEISPALIRRKMVKDGRLVVTGRTITHVNPETGVSLVAAFTINPAKLPREINIISSDERTIPGIYRVEGEELTICFADGRNAVRPAEFESSPGSSRVLLRLKPADDRSDVSPMPMPEHDDVIESKKELSEEADAAPSTLRSIGAIRATPEELARDRNLLAGLWEILSIRDDGETLGANLIREKIAENGLLRIGSRGASVVSPTDEQKRLWAYRIDPAASPKEIDLITQFDSILKGIYTFDGDKLIVCMAKTEDAPRPTEFDAPNGSGRYLYTLKMVPPDPIPTSVSAPAAAPAPAPSPTPEQAARQREQRIRDMIPGTWSMTDGKGTIVTVFRGDGTFTATRTMSQKRLFSPTKRAYDGRWSYGQGVLTARVAGSSDLRMLGYTYTGRVQSIGETSMVSADLTGGLRTFQRLR